jgi:hypothetical protein
MISALFGGAVGLVRKPVLMVPGIIAGLGVTLSFFIFFETTLFFMLDLVSNPNALSGGGSILAVPYLLFALYPAEILSLLAFAALIIATNIWLLQAFAIAEKEGDKAGIATVVFGAFSKIPKVVFTSITIMCLVVLYIIASLAYFALIDLISFIPLLPAIFVLAWIVFSGYLYLKLLFFGTISVCEEKIKGKEGLLRTWNWSSRKILGILVFSILVAIIGNFILGIGFTASDFFDETIGYIVILLFYSLGAAYSSFAFVKYYIHSKDSS